jgi:hypothetical protein
VNNEVKRIWKEAIFAYKGTILEVAHGAEENIEITQNSGCPYRDSNPVPPDYSADRYR